MRYAIKALNEAGDRVGGYAVVFGRTDQTDQTGEFFTKDTYLGLDWPIKERPMLYHHGLDFEATLSPIGVVDTFRVDDIGVWIEARLLTAHKLYKKVVDAIKRGLLSWSSGSAPNMVLCKNSGEIVRWPILEVSATPDPAEKRHTRIAFAAAKSAFNALHLSLDGLVSAVEAQGRETQGSREPAGVERGARVSMEEGMDEKDVEVTQLDPAIGGSNPLEPEPGGSDTVEMETEAPATTEGKRRENFGATKTLPMGGRARVSVSPSTRLEVLRATKYSGLSAQDMSFLAEIAPALNGFMPSTAFFRELADKSIKAVNSGDLPYQAVSGLVRRYGASVKSAEVEGVGNSSYGTEWAADSWRADLWQKVRQENVVAPLFDNIEMPTNPYELPIESTDPVVSYSAETVDQAQLVTTSGGAIPLAKIGSGKVQLSAKKLTTRLAWSAELGEDSAIAVMPAYRKQATRALRNAIDNVIINGDTDLTATTNINKIDGTPGGTEKYCAFNGLRKFGIITNTGQIAAWNAAPTLPLMRAIRAKLSGAYAMRPRDCAWIVDDSTYMKLLNMDEVATADKIGPEFATNRNGLLGMADGIPIYGSAELGLSLATGKVHSSTGNNYGTAILVFRPGWVVGFRRDVRAALEFLSFADAYSLTVTARVCLMPFDTKVAALAYDIIV